MGLGVVGLDIQCHAIMGDGLIKFPRAVKAMPRLKWASTKWGLKFQCLAVMGDGLVGTFRARATPRLSVDSGKSGLISGALLKLGDGLVNPSVGGKGGAEVVVEFRVVGPDFRGRPSAVVGDGLVNCPRAARIRP